MTDKPLRKIQHKPDPSPPPPEPLRGSYLERWGRVIQGTVDLDVDPIHEMLIDALHAQVQQTAGAIVAALERVAYHHSEAVRLAARARRDYELLKEDFEAWLESKRTASRMALEEEKAERGWKKQITESMVMDQVRATWPDEYAGRSEKVRDLQATVHRLEALPESFKMRARALEAQKDVLLAAGLAR